MADFQSCRPPVPGGLAALAAEVRLEEDVGDEAVRDVVVVVMPGLVVVERGMPVHGRGGSSMPSSSVPRGVREEGAEPRDEGEVGDGVVSTAGVAKAMVLVDPERLVVVSSS